VPALKSSPEASNSVSATTEQAEGPAVVFQPQKLTEIVEMIDLMGRISERVREDNSQDASGAGSGGGGTQGKKGKGATASTRDQAIANLPAPLVMQQRLVKHIQKEIDTLSAQASAVARAAQRGSAYAMNELYKKVRRLYALMEEIIHASLEVIQRFYIAVFIDKQPILVSGK
jgi:hypothetical protein